MRSTGPEILFCISLLIASTVAQGGHMSEQRRQYEYQRSYSGGGSGAGCGDCQTSSRMSESGSTWIQQQREEMQRRAEQFRNQFHTAVSNGGMTRAHYKKYHSSSSGLQGADCTQGHQSSSMRKVEERQHVVPQPSLVHRSRKFEESSRNVQQQLVPETSYRFNKEIEERRGETHVPIGGHMSRFFEEEHRQQVHQPPPVVTHFSKKFEEERRNVAPPPPPVTYKIEKKFEEERRNIIQPPPVTYKMEKKIEERKSNTHRVVIPMQKHVTQRVESHQAAEQIPVHRNSYFSVSQAERHRQHANHFPQFYSKHQLEESSQRSVPIPQPVTNYKKTEKIEENKFHRPIVPSYHTVRNKEEDHVYNRPVTHVIKEVEYEDTHHYNKQYEKKNEEEHREFQRIVFPTWVQKQSDRLIYEEYYRQTVTPRDYGRNLTRSEENRFYDYYTKQGGTTLDELKETLEEHYVYPSYILSTDEKKIFEEFYLTHVGMTVPTRNLTTYELEEFEDFYREKLAANIQEKETVYKAKTYNLHYPSWVVMESDKKIFEEYYFSHVPENEYGRELTKDEKVEFEIFYSENGGQTDHKVETFNNSGYRITYPDWVITTEDRAIYEEYYRMVAGENYGRELTEEEMVEFEEFYKTHGGTTKHEAVVEDLSHLSYKVNYPSWIVTQVDKVIFEEFYRLHVKAEEYGRELTFEELLDFEEYYKNRGGNTRKVLEETLFMRLSYPSWLRTEYDRSMFREFYLHQVFVEDYGRLLTEEEESQFVEYYDRHTKGQYETLRGQTDYQWVYPSFVVTRSDRRIFNEYYNQCMASKLDLGRELTESEKIDFQQFFIERGGLYEYRYTREEYLLTFDLDRMRGGSAYQWTWDGVEHMAAELTHLVAGSPDVHHTDDLDKKVYGSTKVEELPSPPPPTTTTTTEKPKKTVISKDRGDQPPREFEEDVETEPGIGPYEPPPEPIIELPSRTIPAQDEYESGHRTKAEHREEHSLVNSNSPGYTEYRRRYEHQRTQSRVVPVGHHSLTSIDDQFGSSSSHHEHVDQHAENLDNEVEMVQSASSKNPQYSHDHVNESEEIEPENPDLMSEDEYENVDLDYQEDQQRRVN
ncbi:uncharacterized protein LOC134832774 isoform X2 [Culicoides brevitarsis]|uniref:uncharacterized protein LOC134832774 isoform X2 n=1 Tax=Culicoides brevitarsis TaxID=469753 RepID=UPI00307CC22E